MLVLFILLLIFLVVYQWAKSPGKPSKDDPYNVSSTDQLLSQQNAKWIAFIKSYLKLAKTTQEKALIERIVQDIYKQGLLGQHPGYSQTKELHVEITKAYVVDDTSKQLEKHTAKLEATPNNPLSNELKIRLDNVSLLLYFGAFLFVASVGLFIAFAETTGAFRTLAAALVTLVMYGTGVWLFKNKAALKPAGLAFAGIGIAIAPLVGVAAYSYVWPDSAAVVWLLTSVFCLGLYAHAIIFLRRPLINYVFLFTMLSLFESSISIIDAPIYFFGWAMAGIGIVLLAVSRLNNIWGDFKESARVSAQLFVPVSVLVSLTLIADQGWGQLGVSFMLAALFYGLEVLATANTEQETNAVVSQTSLLSGVGCLTYAATNEPNAVALTLLIFVLTQAVGIIVFSKQTNLGINFATVAIASAIAAIVFSIGNGTFLLASTFALLFLSLLVWLSQTRNDAFAVASITWLAMPFVIGQTFINPGISARWQLLLVTITLIVYSLVHIFKVMPSKASNLISTSRVITLGSSIVVLAVAMYTTPGVVLLTGFGIALLMVLLSEYDRTARWETAAGIVAAVPVLVCWNDSNLLVIASLVAMSFNILLALRYRSEENRWLSTVLWLLLPFSLGSASFGGNWLPETYAWAYIVVMACLILSRAIARGTVFTSARVPVAVYAKSASLSYVFGYTAAAMLSIVISLFGADSQIHTTLILLVLSVVTFVIANGVEKKPEIAVLYPLLFQATLLSLIRPAASSTDFSVYLALSSLLAVASYLYIRILYGSIEKLQTFQRLVLGSSLTMAAITPFCFFVVGETVLMMPIGLLVFSFLLYDNIHYKTQGYREFSVGLMVGAFMWMLHYLGVREPQAYAHIIAITFAAFAYWRHVKRETAECDKYLMLMLMTATIPLLLQALLGNAGDWYGWWLLLEQVFFMILGMTIHKNFVIKWGLYVAVGSVLYQMRHLGWLALTALAAFIIGIAIYQLQKYNKI